MRISCFHLVKDHHTFFTTASKICRYVKEATYLLLVVAAHRNDFCMFYVWGVCHQSEPKDFVLLLVCFHTSPEGKVYIFMHKNTHGGALRQTSDVLHAALWGQIWVWSGPAWDAARATQCFFSMQPQGGAASSKVEKVEKLVAIVQYRLIPDTSHVQNYVNWLYKQTLHLKFPEILILSSATKFSKH